MLQAARDKGLKVPYVFVDFRGQSLDGLTEITSLDAPHRVYDAILRDSLLNGEPFMKSDLGQRLAKAKPDDATELLQTSPTALLFGAWHSPGEGGGLGAKFARCLVSEIVAVDVPVEELVDTRTGEIEKRTAGRRTGSRIDPLGLGPARSRSRSDWQGLDWAGLYERLKARYGVWELARMEAILRLADHRASEEAAERYSVGEAR